MMLILEDLQFSKPGLEKISFNYFLAWAGLIIQWNAYNKFVKGFNAQKQDGASTEW